MSLCSPLALDGIGANDSKASSRTTPVSGGLDSNGFGLG